MEFALFCLSEKLQQIFACIVRVLDGTIALKRLTVQGVLALVAMNS